MRGSAGPSPLDLMLAGIAILLLAVSIFVFFSVKWWYGFIPAGIAAALVLFVIVNYFRRAIKEIEREEDMF